MRHVILNGFTLAETLITIGIIGIVAAMTLPSLVQKNIEKQRVSQLKKVYSVLAQAYSRAIEEHGSPDLWVSSEFGMYSSEAHKTFAKNISNYLKLTTSCIDMTNPDSVEQKCHAKHKEINMFSNVVLADGAVVTYRMWSNKCEFVFGGTKNICGEIMIDLNGMSRPNKSGEDIFGFYMTKTNIIPYGTIDDGLTFERACNKTIAVPYPGFSNGNMYSCTAWVIYNENQDYLHCNDLSWNGKHKCSKQ